jgi:hypothetical protein
MSAQVTPFEVALEHELEAEWRRFANEWLFKWHGLSYEGGKVDVDSFAGGRIVRGEIFDSQPRQIF